MPLFVCNKCNYSTIVKQNIIKHFVKIRPCNNEILILDRDKYINLQIKNNENNKNNEINEIKLNA